MGDSVQNEVALGSKESILDTLEDLDEERGDVRNDGENCVCLPTGKSPRVWMRLIAELPRDAQYARTRVRGDAGVVVEDA